MQKHILTFWAVLTCLCASLTSCTNFAQDTKGRLIGINTMNGWWGYCTPPYNAILQWYPPPLPELRPPPGYSNPGSRGKRGGGSSYNPRTKSTPSPKPSPNNPPHTNPAPQKPESDLIPLLPGQAPKPKGISDSPPANPAPPTTVTPTNNKNIINY